MSIYLKVLLSRCFSLALIALVLLVPSHLFAVTIWNGDGDGSDWFDDDNWDTDTAPISTERVEINGAAFNVVIGAGVAESQEHALTNGSLSVESGATWTESSVGGTSSSIGTNFTLNVNGGTVSGSASNAGQIDINGTVNVSGDGQYTPSYTYTYVNTATVNLGNATSAGTFDPGRITRAGTTSTFRGWGLIRHGGWSDNYFFGKTIADGWGGTEDRELLFQMNGISDQNVFRMLGGSATSDRGLYATNRSYITLPSLVYSSSAKADGWGSTDTQDAPTAVNAFWLSFDSIDHSGTKNLLGQLYASDVSSVPSFTLDVGGIVTAIYQMTPDADFLFSGDTTFTHRYDHVLAGSKESDLTVYKYNGVTGYWDDLSLLDGYTLTQDLTNNRLALSGFSGLDSISGFFMIGAGVQGPPPVPEPSGLCLVMLGGVTMLIKRRKARRS